MIRIAVLGDIGSGKSYFAKQLKIPLFNADDVVSNLYKKSKSLFIKLKRLFPKYIVSFPINKDQLVKIINQNSSNLKKIIKVVHPMVRKEMNIFLKKNKNKKAVVLDIPLYLENKLNLETDIIVFIDSNKSQVIKRLKKRKNFNIKTHRFLQSLQTSVLEKREKADFVVKNNFVSAKIKKEAKNLLKKILI